MAKTEDYIQLPATAQTGDKIRSRTHTVSGNVVHEHLFQLTDADDDRIARVLDSTPAGTEAGGVVRIAGPVPAGSNDIGDVGVISSVLPTGAATETTLATLATQATMAALNAKFSALGQALAAASTPVVLASDVGLPAGGNNIGDVDILSVPADPFGLNADASSATGSISAKLRHLAAVGLAGMASLPAGGNNIGDVDVLTLPALTDKAAASSAIIGNVSLGSSLGKTNVFVTGNLVTTAVTADQVIATYTVTTLKAFYLQYIIVNGRLTTFATTATLLGAWSLEIVSGTKRITQDLTVAGARSPDIITFTEPICVSAGVVVRLVCTPSATTSFTWKGGFGGYEKAA